MKRNILLVGSAREKSTRVKNKMARPFGKTSLFEIYLRKFERLSQMSTPFDGVIIAVSKSDKILWEMVKSYDVKVVERSAFSISNDAKKFSEVFHYLKDFNEEYIMHVNACFPFLKIDTIIKTATLFKRHKSLKSLSCVRYRYNHFWDVETKKPINNIKNVFATQEIKPIFENVNSMIIYDKKETFKTEKYWDFTENNPFLYPVKDSEECLDIDTDLDFRTCEALWNEQFRK